MTIKDLIKYIEESVAKMEEAIVDSSGLGIIIQCIDYAFNLERYNAYMDVLMKYDYDKYDEVANKYFDTIDAMTRSVDVMYQNLKKGCDIK